MSGRGSPSRSSTGQATHSGHESVAEVGERVLYREAGKAMRQAQARMVALAKTSESDWRVLGAVFCGTVSYSKLVDAVAQSQLVKSAEVSARQVRRSLGRLAEGGVIVWVPGRGAGNKTVVGVPPAGVKADDYLSALGLPVSSAFESAKGDKAAGRKSGQLTRARGDREDVRGEKTVLDSGVVQEPSRRDPAHTREDEPQTTEELLASTDRLLAGIRAHRAEADA